MLPLLVCVLFCSGNIRAEDVVPNGNSDSDSTSVWEILGAAAIMIAPIAFFVWLFFYSERNMASSTPPKNVRIVSDLSKRNHK